MPEALVYLAYDRLGDLLYVGSTGNFAERQAAHKRNEQWWPEVCRWDFETLPTRRRAYWRESDLIRQLRPQYNQPPGPTRGARKIMPPEWVNQRPKDPALDEGIVELHGTDMTRNEMVEALGISEAKLEQRIRWLIRVGRIEPCPYPRRWNRQP